MSTARSRPQIKGAIRLTASGRPAKPRLSKREREEERLAKVRRPTAAYVRTYSDSGQTKAYVEWSDGSRTEGEPDDAFMEALFERAKREGVKVRHEVW